MENMDEKEANIWLEHTSEGTKALVKKRNELSRTQNSDEIKEIKRQIKTQTEADKDVWIDKIADEMMHAKEVWEGFNTLAKDYQPERYVKRDRNGNFTTLDQRAEATKGPK